MEVENLLRMVKEVCRNIENGGCTFSNSQVIDGAALTIAALASQVLDRHVYFERFGSNVRFFCYPVEVPDTES
jgi:hypothetical protein